jgi:hypothetical protein
MPWQVRAGERQSQGAVCDGDGAVGPGELIGMAGRKGSMVAMAFLHALGIAQPPSAAGRVGQQRGGDGSAPWVMGQVRDRGEASIWGYFLGLFFCWSSQNFLSLNGVSLEDEQPQNPQLAMGLGFGRLGV